MITASLRETQRKPWIVVVFCIDSEVGFIYGHVMWIRSGVVGAVSQKLVTSVVKVKAGDERR